MSHKKTNKEFLEEISLIPHSYIITSDYVTCKTKVHCKCLVCKNEWDAYPNDLLSGKGCVVCRNKQSADKRRKSNEQFLRELSEITDFIIPLEEYKGALTKIQVQCKQCQRIWEVEPHSLLQGKGCSSCVSITSGMKMRKSHDKFKQEINAKYPNIILNSKYTLSHEPVNCTCTICNTTFDITAADLLYDGGCPICNVRNLPQRQPKPLDKFLEDLYCVNPNIEYVSDYTKASENVTVKCKICEHVWSPKGTSLTSGYGCPQCAQSHGERNIDKYLHQYNINHIHQKIFNGLIGVGGCNLSYDFYLPEINALIEYQGQYHDGTVPIQTKEEFVKQQEHDKRKTEYANNNNINLLEIWYWDLANIENILCDYLRIQND